MLFGRVYGTWTDHNRGAPTVGRTTDDYRYGRVGFRLDNSPEAEDRFTLIGNYLTGKAGTASEIPNISGPPFSTTVLGDNKNSGANVLWRWEHDISDDTQSTLQVFYDRNNIEAPFSLTGNDLISHIDVFDIDQQIQHQLNERHSLVMGLGYKRVVSETSTVPGFLEFANANRDFNLISAYMQDEITLVPDKSYLTIGAKVSDNTFSGFEIQPTARLLWLPDERHSVWAAVSRAVRLPTFFDVDATVTLPAVSTMPVAVFPQQSPEQPLSGQGVLAFEVGVRGQPTESISWDVATFMNQYDNLGEGPALGLTAVSPGVFTAGVQRGSGGSAESYGAELASTLDLSERLRVRGSYTYTRIYGTTADTKQTPVNQLYLQSSLEVTKNVEADLIWRYVDVIPGVVSHYNVMDMRLAWRPGRQFEWAVVARNLLDNKHPEFSGGPIGGRSTQVPTSVYSMITWQY